VAAMGNTESSQKQHFTAPYIEFRCRREGGLLVYVAAHV